MGTRETLEGVLAFYERKEWIQGTGWRLVSGKETNLSIHASEYSVQAACLEGACYLSGQYTEGVIAALERSIQQMFPGRIPPWLPVWEFNDHPMPVWEFNDHPDTTLEDVILVVKGAIANLEE